MPTSSEPSRLVSALRILPALVALSIAAAIVFGLFALDSVGAQAQPNRTIGIVRIFADQFVDGPAGTDTFTATGNLKLGLADKEPLMTISGTNARIARDEKGGPVRVFGAPKLIADTRPISANVATKPLTPTAKPLGFILDTNTGELQGSEETVGGSVRNAQYVMGFLSYFGLDQLYEKLDDQALSRITFKYSLQGTPLFNASLVVDLSTRSNEESPPTTINVGVVVDERGRLSGSVANFGIRYGGVVLSINGARVITGGFTVDVASVLLANNPNFPKLDPAAPDGTSFRINGLTYQNGEIKVLGGAVGLPTIEFANAFSITNGSISIVNDPVLRRASTVITGSIRFGGVVTRSGSLNTSLRFTSVGAPRAAGRTTVMSGTVSDVNLNAGIVQFQLKQLAFTGSTGDGANGIWGIDANDAQLKFPNSLSSAAGAKLTDFRVGTNASGDLKVNLGGLSAATPPLATTIFSGTSASAAFATVNDHLFLTFTLSLNLRLAGGAKESITQTTSVNPELSLFARSGPRVRSSCSPSQLANGCLVAFRGNVDRFAFNAAGFRIDVQNPTLRDDGGFETANAKIGLPVGTGDLTVGVQNLVVNGQAQISISGGEFSLPPLQFGDVSFPTLRGSFKSVTVNNRPGYRLEAGGKLLLPGLESGATSVGLDVSVVFQTLSNGQFDEAGVSISFQVPQAAAGIPIGPSGLAITGMSGSFTIANVSSTTPDIVFTAGVVVQSLDGFAIPGIGTVAIVTIDGTVTVDTKPFSIVAEAVVKFLIFRMANVEVGIGVGQGIGSGFGGHFSFEKFDVFVWPAPFILLPYSVEGEVRVGSSGGNFKVSGTGRVAVEIPAELAGPGLPPFPLTLAELLGSFGEFNIPGTKDTVGALTTYRYRVTDPLFGNTYTLFSLSMFFDFRKAVDSGSFFKFVDPEDYKLRTSLDIAQEALRGHARFGFAETEVFDDGRSPLVAATAPFTISKPGSALFGLSYTGVAPVTPTLTLTLPSGVTLTRSSVNGTTQFYQESAATTLTGTSSAFFVIKNAPPGSYQLGIADAPSDFRSWAYVLNDPPVITDTVAIRAGNAVTLTWQATDEDSPRATVRVGFVPVVSGTIDLSATRFLTEGLALGEGSFVWSLADVQSGTFRMVVEAADDKNLPQTIVADLDIVVVDTTPPAVPAGLAVAPLPGMATFTWLQGTELDLGGYEVGFALTPDITKFAYTRNVGPRETTTTTTETGARIWGLEDNQTVYFSVRAYDLTGNYSDWAPFVAGKPWPLSPRNIAPAGGMTLTDSIVEVSLNTPLNPDRLAAAFSIVAFDGTPIPGSYELIEDIETGEVIGFRFRALVQRPVAAVATLRGGPSGVLALDGRTMPADYAWSFTIVPQSTYLPVTIVREPVP